MTTDIRTALLLGAAFFALPTAALAQTPAAPPVTSATPASDGAIADIVVTAQRRAESVQNVPIAISAFSREDIEARNITSTLGIAQQVPNLVAHNNTGLGSANAYFLRGIGTTESLATQDPPVGTYLDDIYISRQSANNFSLFNVERIEVLRGPQGTLFGRNTTGGAINVILAKPAREFGGFAEVTYGSFSRVTARASVDLPASPALLFNLSGYFIDDAGYVKNITTGERLNNQHAYGIRAALRATPLDNVTWDLSGMYTDERSSNILNFDCNPADKLDCEGRFASTGLKESNKGLDQFPTSVVSGGLTVSHDKGKIPLGARTKFALISSDVRIDLGPKTALEFISGYINTKQTYLVDFFDGRSNPAASFTTDPATGRPTTYGLANNVNPYPAVLGLATGGFDIANVANSEQFTQEVKLNGQLGNGLIDYVAGVFYYHETNVTDFADLFTSTTTRLVSILADRTVTNKTRALAGYTQVDFNLTDQLKLTAGVRYTDEKKTFDFVDNRAACQVTPLPTTCLNSVNFTNVVFTPTLTATIPLSQQVKIWTPRVAINFKPSDDVLLFASATRGFKSGSQSARATAIRTLLPFGPEKVWSYEAGIKSELFDRHLRVNLTGFMVRVNDFQGGSAFINPTTGALSFVTRNLGQLKNDGIEAEILAVPRRGLTLSLNAGIQNARYGIDSSAPAINQFNLLSVAAQQKECVAALGGAASPIGDARTALARASSSCGNGLVTPTGAIAKPTRTPKLTLSGGISYKFEIENGATLTPSVNISYYSSQEVGTANLTLWQNSAGIYNLARDGTAIVGSFQKAYALVSAGIAFATADQRITASLSCDNCFDKAAFQSTLSNFSYLNPPASVTLRLKTRF